MSGIGDCIRTIATEEGEVSYWSLRELEEKGVIKDLSKMPYSIKIIVENMLRRRDGEVVTDDDVIAAASWSPEGNDDEDIPWMPARVLLQDLTGGAAVADLASMREAVAGMGKDPELINPMVPVDLVIDHSLITDYAGRDDAQELNEKLDFERNSERYALFKWAQKSLRNFRAVPSGNGICHQVHLERFGKLANATIDFPAVKEGHRSFREAYTKPTFKFGSYTTSTGALGSADIIINATPVGMKSDDPAPFDTGVLRPGQVVMDAVYASGRTKLVADALAADCKAAFNGGGMLVAQAVASALIVSDIAEVEIPYSEAELFNLMADAAGFDCPRA